MLFYVPVENTRLQILGLYLAPNTFKWEGIYIVPHLLWLRVSVFVVSLEGLSQLSQFLQQSGGIEDQL